jgi:molybdopterin/thiamine biosynthesis adenylyltransferase
MNDRYAKQVNFTEIGAKGRKKLSNSYVVIIGSGSIGTVAASALARAGVGGIRIIDRDSVDYGDLEQDVLFNENDVANQLPKAIAAERHLKKVNSSIEVEGIVTDVNHTNIGSLVSGANLILGGLRNDETFFVINDISMKYEIPWIHGTAVASRGSTMNIIPHETPCYRCHFASPLSHGTIYLTNTVGVISPATFTVGALMSVEAMKILIDIKQANRDRIVFDTWKETFHHLKHGNRGGCPACHGNYEFLEGKSFTKATRLCSGGQAVEVLDPSVRAVSLEGLAMHLKLLGQVAYSEYMLRFSFDSTEMVVFPDGRAIVKNTDNEPLALELYAKYIKN